MSCPDCNCDAWTDGSIHMHNFHINKRLPDSRLAHLHACTPFMQGSNTQGSPVHTLLIRWIGQKVILQQCSKVARAAPGIGLE